MNEKEEMILKEIISYIKDNHYMPTRRYLQKKLAFKSVNSITWYLKSLEKQNYLIRNNEGKIILNKNSKQYDNGLKNINFINKKKQYIQLYLDKNKKYLAFEIHHNYFCDKGINKNDILIIEVKKKPHNNDLALFVLDNKYRIMKYNYKDGFYFLQDKEELLLNKIKMIGKVIMVEKKLWISKLLII